MASAILLAQKRAIMLASLSTLNRSMEERSTGSPLIFCKAPFLVQLTFLFMEILTVLYRKGSLDGCVHYVAVAKDCFQSLL